MANDIASFFGSAADENPADSVAAHMRSFWDPRMRRQILEHYAAGGEGLDTLAQHAIAILARKDDQEHKEAR